MLTKKQKELYEYLDHYIKSNQISPSFEEMKKAVNLKSKSGIHRIISALEEREFIRRLPNRARAIELIRNSDDVNEYKNEHLNKITQLPLYGKIAAGTPIEALSNSDTFLNNDFKLIKSIFQ